MNPAEQPQVQKITDARQPVFPCWLWAYESSSKLHDTWIRVQKECASYDGPYYWYSHWHPDQPSAPTVRPDENVQEAILCERCSLPSNRHQMGDQEHTFQPPHSPASKGVPVPEDAESPEEISNLIVALSLALEVTSHPVKQVGAHWIEQAIHLLKKRHALCPSLPLDGVEKCVEEIGLQVCNDYEVIRAATGLARGRPVNDIEVAATVLPILRRHLVRPSTADVPQSKWGAARIEHEALRQQVEHERNAQPERPLAENEAVANKPATEKQEGAS